MCSQDIYLKKLRNYLFQNEVCKDSDIIDLYIEYAQMTQEYQLTFDYMMEHSIGLKEPHFYHFFFGRFKEQNPQKALLCIQTAKQYCYSNFDKIDEMSKELENFLIKSLKVEYIRRGQSNQEIENKFAQFEQKVFQSKNKRIQVCIDPQFRTLSLKDMIQEYQQLQCVVSKDILNPEEDEDEPIKLLKPKFHPNKTKSILSPHKDKDIAAISEELSKLTPISSSSDSNKYPFNLHFAPKSTTNQEKIIVKIPIMNQYSPFCSASRMKFKNIQKLRELLLENEKSVIKEPLPSPQN